MQGIYGSLTAGPLFEGWSAQTNLRRALQGKGGGNNDLLVYRDVRVSDLERNLLHW
jgi:hypothetical protein